MACHPRLTLLGPLMGVLMASAMVMTPVAASASRVGAAAGKTTSVRMYLVALGDHGTSGKKIGCGDSLVAVIKRVAPTKAPLTAAIRAAVSNHRQFYGQSGLYNALHESRLSLKRATVMRGTATIHLTGQMRLGGVCDAPRVRAQLRHAALQFPSVHRVFVYVNGVALYRAVSGR